VAMVRFFMILLFPLWVGAVERVTRFRLLVVVVLDV
jgi:hypothetical protein